MSRRGLPPQLAAFLAVVLWGLSFVATRLALREVTPLVLVTLRFALGTALLWMTLAAQRVPPPPRTPGAPWRGWGSWAFSSISSCRPTA